MADDEYVLPKGNKQLIEWKRERRYVSFEMISVNILEANSAIKTYLDVYVFGR